MTTRWPQDALHDRPANGTCRYGGSPLAFRGPARRLTGAYVAALGGSATAGRFVARPWPDLLEHRAAVPCVNLGVAHAGPDVFAADDMVMEICANARLTVLEVPEATGVDNRFYRVHPRRNDRVIAATAALHDLFPHIEYGAVHFTRHLLHVLGRQSEANFAPVREALRRAWAEGMAGLIASIPGRLILLWLGDRSPDAPGDHLRDGTPALVTRAMLTPLTIRTGAAVEVFVDPAEWRAPDGKAVGPDEAAAAAAVPGPAIHEMAARLLAGPVRRALAEERAARSPPPAIRPWTSVQVQR